MQKTNDDIIVVGGLKSKKNDFLSKKAQRSNNFGGKYRFRDLKPKDNLKIENPGTRILIKSANFLKNTLFFAFTTCFCQRIRGLQVKSCVFKKDAQFCSLSLPFIYFLILYGNFERFFAISSTFRRFLV